MEKHTKLYTYYGTVDELLQSRVIINVSYMPRGRYEIVIMHEGHVVKKINFEKK